MPAAKIRMYSGWPGDSSSDICCSQPIPGELPEPLGDGRRRQQQARREDRRNDAGHVDLQRQVARLGLIDPAALLALGVIDRDSSLAALDEHHESTPTRWPGTDDEQSNDVDVTLARRFERLADGGGNPATMPEKISSEMPLPTPRSVICSPSHIMNNAPVTRVTVDDEIEGEARA
jgi:hypothetical protein